MVGSEFFHCENCGAPLSSIDAVCLRCEGEVAATEADSSPDKYRCPACHGRFDRAEPVWLPRDAPWYRPQTQELQCPLCKTLLRNRGAIHRRASEYVVMAAVVFLSGFSPWRPGIHIVLGVLYLLHEVLRWWRIRSDVFEEEDRYAILSLNQTLRQVGGDRC